MADFVRKAASEVKAGDIVIMANLDDSFDIEDSYETVVSNEISQARDNRYALTTNVGRWYLGPAASVRVKES